MQSYFLVAFATVVLSLTGCGSADKPTTVSLDRPVIVVANQSLVERIDAGHYSLVSSEIQPNFKVESIPAAYEAKLVVIRFNRSISSENAIEEMRVRRMRPVNTAECLAYGAAISQTRRQFDLEAPSYPLVCLGSTATIGRKRHVLGFGSWHSGWDLANLSWASWSSKDRFLAVRL